MNPDERTSLGELAALFFRLGTTAFGGPPAHIAMMRDEAVVRRRWMSEARFLDLLGAANLIPGPSSTELALHIGWQRRGLAGLIVAGLCFIVPAMLITGGVAWAYVRAGSLPQAQWLMGGVKPVILAVIAQAVVGLLPTAARTNNLRLLALAAAVGSALGVNALGLLCAAGALSVITRKLESPTNASDSLQQVGAAVPAAVSQAALGAGAATIGTVSALTLPALFWVFFKTGAVLFGSGYVLLSFLRADLVQRLGWLTESQLMDAIAIGQITPGPVFTTATFIGYILAGPRGALVATAGIFLPAFILVALSGPLVPRLRASKSAGAFLDGVNAASLSLMAVVGAQLGRAALVDLPSIVLAIAALAILLRFKLNPSWLVLGGACAGWAIHALG